MPTKGDFPSGSIDPPVAIALVNQYTSKASKTSELHTAGLMGLPVPLGPIALTLSGPNLAEMQVHMSLPALAEIDDAAPKGGCGNQQGGHTAALAFIVPQTSCALLLS